MPYYPKSQILPNQKTNGKEFIDSSTGEEYKGDYHKLSNGATFTGKNPQDGPNIQLFPLPPTSNDTSYNTPSDPFESEGISPIVAKQDSNFYRTSVNKTYFNSDSNFSQRKSPKRSNTTPTEKDNKLGIFTRYFCKKNNELKYFEINKETHNLLSTQNSSIAWDLYSSIPLLWYIKGNKQQIYTLNKGLSKSIEKKNQWYGFSQYFKDKFTQFYLED
jgi:hypothetical protein